MGVKLLKTDIHRENLYNFIKANPKCTVDQMAKHLGFTKSQTKHYLNPMVVGGYFKREHVYINRGMYAIYTAHREYKRIVKSDEELFDEAHQKEFEKLPEHLQKVARVVKLGNKNMQPPRRKRRGGSVFGLQSSMSMFNEF